MVARPCEVSWELFYSLIVCVDPLRLRGLREKKNTPSIGWEVPVRSQWLASMSWSERKNMTSTSDSSMSVMVFWVKLLIALRLRL